MTSWGESKVHATGLPQIVQHDELCREALPQGAAALLSTQQSGWRREPRTGTFITPRFDAWPKSTAKHKPTWVRKNRTAPATQAQAYCLANSSAVVLKHYRKFQNGRTDGLPASSFYTESGLLFLSAHLSYVFRYARLPSPPPAVRRKYSVRYASRSSALRDR